MKRAFHFLFLLKFIVLVLILSACSSDNEEEFYNTIVCDTIDISYANDVLPILENNCLSCHFNGNSTGVDLGTYDDVKINADNSRLLGAVKQLPGFSPMPPNGKLDECSIKKIESWIDNGAQNN